MEMDLKTKIEVLPCGKCEDMISCDNCLFQKEAKELYNEIYNQALEDLQKMINYEYYDGGYGDYHEVEMIARMIEQLRK